MHHTSDELVWYASYGSNCDASRFSLYLEGGHREGTTGNHRGARDPSPPRDSAAIEFPSQITYAGRSRRWGGGVAFLEHHHVTGATLGALGRRYLITRGQFEDVVAQENARPTTPVETDSLSPGELRVTGTGWYGALVALEPVKGVPVITFTSPDPPELAPALVPALEYLRTIAVGLHQIHNLDWDRIIERLLVPTVVSARWNHDELLLAITGTRDAE